MKIYDSLPQLIGNTPLLRLNLMMKAYGAQAQVLAKLEYLNPLGSIKDRAALYMIEDAEKRGILSPGATVIEPTSGNTGIGLAYICALKGYRLILTMPETMSVERRQLLAALGAEIVLTAGSRGMSGSIEKAQEIAAATPGSFIPQQFENPANAQAHSETTAQELLRDTDGQIDVLVSAVGTGGTLTGTGRVLKAHRPSTEIIAVEPASSAVLSGKAPGKHKIQGIGAGFVPKLLDVSLIDRVVTVTDEDAYACAQALAKKEGVLAGISSGAAVRAALEVAAQDNYAGKTIAVILPDTGQRYLSAGLFDAKESNV